MAGRDAVRFVLLYKRLVLSGKLRRTLKPVHNSRFMYRDTRRTGVAQGPLCNAHRNASVIALYFERQEMDAASGITGDYPVRTSKRATRSSGRNCYHRHTRLDWTLRP